MVGNNATYPLSAEVRAYAALAIDLVKAILWPAVAALVLLRFREVIVQAIGRSKKMVFKIAGAEVELSAGEVSEALSEVFGEIDVLLEEHLSTEEKHLFLQILNRPRPPKVEAVLPEFERNTPAHKNLRALRGAYFIRPIEGGTWQRWKHIEVTTLGRVVAKHKRAALEGRADPKALER